MGRIIDTEGKILVPNNKPSILISGKQYSVDDRKSTFDKIEEVQKDTSLDSKEIERKIFELALGEKNAKEILSLDLSVQDYMYLVYCVMGAITGKDPDELKAQADLKK